MAEFKMATTIKLGQNEWVKFVCANGGEGSVSEVFFCANGGNQSWQVWVCLRGKTKMAESNMAKFKMAEFKMAAIIMLIENEWVWVRLNYFESESEWRERVLEWIWEKKTRCLNSTMQKLYPRWQNSRWQNSRWLPSSSESKWISLSQSQSGGRVFLGESERR